MVWDRRQEGIWLIFDAPQASRAMSFYDMDRVCLAGRGCDIGLILFVNY